jgi:hypothetical protein
VETESLIADHFYPQTSMRSQFIIGLLCLALVGWGCGPLQNSEPPLPPQAAPYTAEANGELAALIEEFDQHAQRLLSGQGYAIAEPQMYTTTVSVAEVSQFYSGELERRGWERAPNDLPDGDDQAVLIYRRNEALFIVAALDTTPYSGPGALIYTLSAEQ